MRNIVLSSALVVWGGLAWASPPKQVLLHVDNMTCPACTITIEKALDKVPGVATQRIDSESATVMVTFDADRTNAAAIAKAITEAGFPANIKSSASGG